MNDILIRDAGNDDANGIAHVQVAGWLETYRGMISDSFLDKILSDPNDVYHRAFVAIKDGQIVGFANYGKEHSGDSDYLGELFAIYVLKEFQGQGIGRELVKHVAQGLLNQEVLSMLVWVLVANPYQQFYESLGGVYLREQTIVFEGESLYEKAYGWKDIRPLAGEMKG